MIPIGISRGLIVCPFARVTTPVRCSPDCLGDHTPAFAETRWASLFTFFRLDVQAVGIQKAQVVQASLLLIFHIRVPPFLPEASPRPENSQEDDMPLMQFILFFRFFALIALLAIHQDRSALKRERLGVRRPIKNGRVGMTIVDKPWRS